MAPASLEQTTNAIRPSIRRADRFRDFVISRFQASRLSSGFSFEPSSRSAAMGMIGMNHVLKACCLIGLSVSILAPAAHADEFQLSNNQRISCSRGLSPGKLSTATCKSYAYVFNAKTSEYFRCSVSHVADARQQGSDQQPERRRLRQEAPHLRHRFQLFVRRHRNRAAEHQFVLRQAATRSGPATTPRAKSAAASSSVRDWART